MHNERDTATSSFFTFVGPKGGAKMFTIFEMFKYDSMATEKVDH